MQPSAKAGHLARSNEGRIYAKYQVQNFIQPTRQQSILFTYTGEVDFAITSCVKCTK